MNEQLVITIDGEVIAELPTHLASLRVELDEEMAGMVRLRIGIEQAQDGSWSWVDDPRLRVWKPIQVAVGFDDGPEDLFDGYITHVRPVFEPDPNACALEIQGLDASVLLDREEVLKDWPNKKDSDIVSEIFAAHGLSAEVEDTATVHDEAISTIIQRETDMRFVRRLAARNGFECFVDARTGHFHPPALDAEPQPLLAAHFGEETTLTRFEVQVDALRPAGVSMHQIDRLTKEVLSAAADAPSRDALGAAAAAALLGPDVPAGLAVVAGAPAPYPEEMQTFCQALFDQADWLVTAEGEVNANRYGSVLRPRKPVTVKGVGETHSGVYYVTRTVHVVDPGGYRQEFRARRNAIDPTGDEDFGAAGGLF